MMLIDGRLQHRDPAEACPLSSVSSVQLPAPPHAGKETAGVAVKKTLAPLTGVSTIRGQHLYLDRVGRLPADRRSWIRSLNQFDDVVGPAP